MIKAILFDVDGTLLDTTEYIYQAFEHSLAFHGLDKMTRSEMSHSIGKPLEDCYRDYSLLQGVDHLMDSHKEFQLKNPTLSFPFENSLSTLMALKSNNILIAAITTRAKVSALQTLKSAKLFGLLDFFVAREDVKNLKPDPEPLYKALDFLGLDADEAIMVGDSPDDVLAGKNAGTKTVGVTYGFHGDRIIDCDPNFVIDDIGEIIQVVSS